jgi:hypothetical protein
MYCYLTTPDDCLIKWQQAMLRNRSYQLQLIHGVDEQQDVQ